MKTAGIVLLCVVFFLVGGLLTYYLYPQYVEVEKVVEVEKLVEVEKEVLVTEYVYSNDCPACPTCSLTCVRPKIHCPQ